MEIGSLARALFGGRAATAGPIGITRTEAAQTCARALRQRRIPAMVHAPHANAGRVAIVVGLMRGPQVVQVGWLEVPLFGAIEWNDHGSALAAQATPLVLSIVRSAMENRRVIPVPPDARIFQVSEQVRVMQAATGAWQVVGRHGAVHATLDTPELAVEAARKVDGERAPSRFGGDPVRITLDPPAAARWLAHHLRELGVEASARGADVHVGGERATIHAGGTATFSSGMPPAARSAIEAGVHLVRVVEHLE